MQRYLLFDSGCMICTQLANALEQETGGWLTARSLREQEMQNLLDAAKPGWQWEPTLLEVENGRSHVYTGIGMRARMAIKLGPRQAFQIARLLQRYAGSSASTATHLPSRVSFLKGAAAATGGLLALSMGMNAASASSGGSNDTSLPFARFDGPEADRYISLALASPQYARARAKLATTYANTLTAAEDGAYAVNFPALNKVGVHVPFTGGAGYSHFTAIFDGSTGQIAETMASFYTLDGSGNVVAYVERNERPLVVGVLTQAGVVVTGSYYDASGQAIALSTIAKSGSVSTPGTATSAVSKNWFCCLTNCLASQGIPMWIVSMVSILCGVACAITLGLGCVVCVAGVSFVGEGVAAWCAAQCLGHRPFGGCTC